MTDEFEHSYEQRRLVPADASCPSHDHRVHPRGRVRLPTLANLALAEVEDVVNLSLTTTVEPADLLRQWRPGSSTAERAAAIAEFAMVAALPEQRLVAMDMLGGLEPVGEVEPAVRQMLDSRCAGQRRCSCSTRACDAGGAGLVPRCWAARRPARHRARCARRVVGPFSRSYALADDDLLEELWRHDQPETVEILDALGKHLPDKQLAKAARRAALKHRSWMANRQR